ncbi:LptF/LptG family permease [Vaginella massiliensis]|uniref:LptF/LptG family permease n=1 Tax=Vaginella massiliensis TaxID=1816680 RepID=UPI000837F53A|nr:LptF/LptG family permease [Vaginella massiliensis]
MIKKLDSYILKTFIGPFFFIFSILFFIFIVQFAWQQMDKYVGKGLDWLTIGELIFYMGINVIQLVLPLTILLGSIMTFGGFGERYELAAMKASGLSLVRILRSVFVLVVFLSVGLYLFGDYMMPYSQRKARQIMYTIVKSRPAMQISEGIFINTIPGYSMKVNRVEGENNEKLTDIFIHQQLVKMIRDENGHEQAVDQDPMTIIAQKGSLKTDSVNPRFLKLELFDGIAYTEEVFGKNFEQRKRQNNETTKFDTLNFYIDISLLVDKTTDQDPGNHYKNLQAKDLKLLIDSVKLANQEFYTRSAENNYLNAIYYDQQMKDLSEQKNADNHPSITLDKVNPDRRDLNLNNAIISIERDINNNHFNIEEDKSRKKFMSRITLHYHRNWSYAVTCIIFFFIGAPLGAIVKKGGVGMPVIISIIVFILYFIVNLTAENMAKNGTMHPFLAGWAANFLFFPFSILLLLKANNDSGLFDLSKYTDPLIKFFGKFNKKRPTEHSRYQ